MRSKKRIRPFLRKFEELWLMFPDMRFWQIINLLEVPEDLQGQDTFFYEEDEWTRIIQNTIDVHTKEHGDWHGSFDITA